MLEEIGSCTRPEPLCQCWGKRALLQAGGTTPSYDLGWQPCLPSSALLHMASYLHNLGEEMVQSGIRWGLLHCSSCWCPVPARLLSLFLAALGTRML